MSDTFCIDFPALPKKGYGARFALTKEVPKIAREFYRVWAEARRVATKMNQSTVLFGQEKYGAAEPTPATHSMLTILKAGETS